jgi:flagellar protein FliJ
MAQPSALDTLIELASTATDEAAKRLGQAIRVKEEAESKLSLLQQYRDDYAARFQSELAAGLTAQGYRNFQQFLGKLDQAIKGQQQVIANAEARVDRERNAWQESERRRISYDTLATRAEKAAQHKQNKRDQKSMDEHAARQLLYKR